MKSIILSLSILIVSFAYGQTIGAYSAPNYGRFYHINRESSAHFYSEYRQQIGFRAGIEMKDIKIDSLLNFKFALGYEKYGGYFYTRDGGNGGYVTDEGTISKDVLTLQFYPVNFKIAKHLTIRAGVEMNALLHYQLTGTQFGYVSPVTYGAMDNTQTVNLTDIDGFVKKVNYGFNFSLGYEFKIKNLIFEPHYNFYLGTTPEFEKLQANTKSLRQSVGVSVGYGLK